MSHNSCLILHRSASTNPTMRMSDGPRPVRKRHNHGRSLRETASKPPQQQPPKPPQPQQLPSPSLSAETAIPSFIHDDTICPVQNPVKADNQSSTHSDYSSHGSDSSSQSHEDSTKQQLTLATENAPLHQSMDVYLDHIEDDQDEIVRMTRRNKDILLARLHEVVPNGKLAVINLSRRGLGVADAYLLKEAIVRNPLLSVLRLCYNELGDEGVTIVASALEHNGEHHPKLSVLDIGFNDVGDSGCTAVALKCVAGNYSLQTLFLSGNNIGVSGALSLAGAIMHGSGLTNLHLTANKVGCTGMKAIASAIVKCDQGVHSGVNRIVGIRQLHISHTSISSQGFASVAGMLLSNSSLQVLHLAGLGINDHDLALLSQALAQNKSVPIEVLDLSFNQITCYGVECLMNAIWGSPSLRSINLGSNRIQDRGAQLCAVVLTSIPLEELDLSFNNQISTTGIKALMKNISENNSMKSLSLSGIHLDQNSSKALSYALAYNTSLRSLYLDNCSAGYASQRHIVAGIVSNQKTSLRVLTGFTLGPIAMTLGMPRLPDNWTNGQVLGFVRFMWQQWLLKSGRGREAKSNDGERGPAPPAAVASAAKIAFSSLGAAPSDMFKLELYEASPSEQPPLDKGSTALMERTDSGTVCIPVFTVTAGSDIQDWILEAKEDRKEVSLFQSSPSAVRSSMEDHERRNKNMLWLRLHHRSLSEIGRLPFNNADLWQLHQYYFSPPYQESSDGENAEGADEVIVDQESPGNATEMTSTVTVADVAESVVGLNVARTVSYHVLGDAVAPLELFNRSVANSHKRRSDVEAVDDSKPAAKRPRNLKTRIAFYPRIMEKVHSLGTKPMELTLSILRQLKYVESVIFHNNSPYNELDIPATGSSPHSDIEMILLDLM